MHSNAVPVQREQVREQGGARAPTELSEQSKLALWLNEAGVLWCHVPNEGKRSKRYGRRLRAQGLKPGVPDVLVFAIRPGEWPCSVRGWAVELKRRDERAVASGAQSRWLRDLAAAGWATTVCHGADEAIAWFKGQWGA